MKSQGWCSHHLCSLQQDLLHSHLRGKQSRCNELLSRKCCKKAFEPELSGIPQKQGRSRRQLTSNSLSCPNLLNFRSWERRLAVQQVCFTNPNHTVRCLDKRPQTNTNLLRIAKSSRLRRRILVLIVEHPAGRIQKSGGPW